MSDRRHRRQPPGLRRPGANTQRADSLLVERGLAPSRNKAQALVLAGDVLADGAPVDKPGALLRTSVELIVKQAPRFVSRGGDKLEHACRVFAAHGLEVDSKICVDIGASTGGFTDCLLQRGAGRVYAVDVGYGQLNLRLRDDPRVVVRERTNARGLGRADFPEGIDLVVVDASFIRLATLLPAIDAMLPAHGELVALVKPQFEAGRAEATRGRGVIRDERVRETAIGRARTALSEAGFEVVAETDSPLRGPKGNLERLIYARRQPVSRRT